MMLKARQICNDYGRGIPYVMILSYILDKGEHMISQIEDSDIEELEGNGMMTKDFVQGMVRAAREVVRNCTQEEIVQLFKAEWCCSGEHYDPDLGQFVNDVEKEEEEW